MSMLDVAREWAEHDPCAADRDAVLRLVETGDVEALAPLFQGPLSFGTAGLRAPVGPGESQLNVAVITRVTWGLMAWLREKIGSDPVVVIGCDARHGSAEFQLAAAGVVKALGGRALVLPAQHPTPLTAFAVKHYGADAGIMVTASHNPPADNGYKVYLGGRVATGDAEGVQLVSPADAEIAASFARAPFADEIAVDTAGLEHVDPRDDYVARAAALAGPDRSLKIALTAMHGVGGVLGSRILTELGFDVSLVPEQAQPNPDFPTVSFPNPEENGALDLAKTHATQVGADIIIAYDPDADRCAVAIPAEESWQQLSGDETGALLGSYLAERGATGAFANSIVSSRLLSRIAESKGLSHAETLTGFKWIARTPNLAFGYEEAIGYCCDPAHVADKDGITASVLVASMAATLKAVGRTLRDKLDELAREHGLYLTAPLTFRVEDVTLIAEGMAALRANPPAALAGSPVVELLDMAKGEHPCGVTEGIFIRTTANDRVIVRPSGTEPKLKCYLEVVLPAQGVEIPRPAAKQRLDDIAAELAEILGLNH